MSKVSENRQELGRGMEQPWIDSFVASSTDALIAFDSRLRIRFLNPAASFLFGKESKDLLGASLQSLGYLGAIISPMVSKVLRSSEVVQSTFEMPQGEELLVFEASFNPTSESSGAEGVFGVLRDISSRHLLAEELKESKNRLETQSRALEVFDIVSETDLTGRLTYVNDRFCQLSGYSREELVGSDFRLVNSGYHSRSFFKRLWRKLSGGEVWTGEIRNRRKDQSHYWVQSIIAPIFDEDGKLDRFLSIQRDISKKRDKQERDEEFVRRFNQILQNSHSMIVSTNIRGDVLFANASFLKTIGLEERAVVGKVWIDAYIPAGQRKEIQRLWLKSVNEKSESKFESNIVTESGEPREVRWTLSPLQNEESEVFGMTLVGEDVTEKRSTQEAMDQLQKDVHLKTQNVLSFVSHQLKNGLLSINAGLDIINDEMALEELKKEKIEDVIIKIKKRVDDLESFSRELLQNFAEDRVSLRLKLQTFALKSLLMTVVERFKTDYRDKPVEFLVDFPRQDIIVNWDMLKVDELITNLMSNAVKYLKPEGGRVDLKIRKIHENILLSINDNGIGIPSDSLESLFEWFSRGNVTHLKSRKGFGVGLRFCKEVVSKHEGRIWLESKPEIGTSFHCLIPQDPRKK